MPPLRTFAGKGVVLLVLSATAVAAFGMTFHYFGSSAVVPGPSRQFGFWVLSPVAVIDRIFIYATGSRPIWLPVPMFLVLWTAYSVLALIVVYVVRKKKSMNKN
ncbi:MAG TPA: hypothetical protein VFW78_10530 [Bacteroidia bacterium]|nr:hypothetical protein [Bacteroidia bacterium]